MIKNRLRSILKNKGISIVQLSNDTGLNRQTIYQFMNNKGLTYNLNTMNVICDYLNMNISDIIYYSEKELEFKFEKFQNSVEFNFDKIKQVNQSKRSQNGYISRFDDTIDTFKNGNKVDSTIIEFHFFKFHDTFFLAYDLGNISEYEKSIFSNMQNMVKISEMAIKHVADYATAIKIVKNNLSEPLGEFDDVPIDCINEFSKIYTEKSYKLQIIPTYLENDNEIRKDMIAQNSSDTTLRDLKSNMYSSNRNINITNVKEKKHFGCMYTKFLDKGYFLKNIDE